MLYPTTLEPPSCSGFFQLSLTALLATSRTTTSRGEPTSSRATLPCEGALNVPRPAKLSAATRNSYSRPFCRFTAVPHKLLGGTSLQGDHIIEFLSFISTWYPVMDEPPSSRGAFQ